MGCLAHLRTMLHDISCWLHWTAWSQKNIMSGKYRNKLDTVPGADIVGGETDIATVTKHEGFKWIRRKHYYPPELNLMETDHVR